MEPDSPSKTAPVASEIVPLPPVCEVPEETVRLPLAAPIPDVTDALSTADIASFPDAWTLGPTVAVTDPPDEAIEIPPVNVKSPEAVPPDPVFKLVSPDCNVAPPVPADTDPDTAMVEPVVNLTLPPTVFAFE
jgi:hypothetical protein